MRFIAADESLAIMLPARLPPGPIVLGVRPEHVSIGADGLPAKFILDLVEPIGNEMYVYATAGPHHVVARIAPQELPRIGSPIDVSFNAAQLHFFNAKSGERITNKGS